MTIKIEMKLARKIYEGLPQHLQDLILSEKTANIIFETGQKNNLDIKQIMNLATITGDVLFGLTPLEKFLTELKKQLKLDDEKIVSIASEIHQKIFLPIKETLRNVYLSTQKQIEPIIKKEETKKEVAEKEIPKIKKVISKNIETPTKPTPPPIRPPVSSQPPRPQAPKPPEITKPEIPKPPETPKPQQPTPQKTAELKRDLLEELMK